MNKEEELFEAYREKSDFCVSGFSYGATKALEYTLKTDTRVDKLQLFSPAYFVKKNEKYTRMQLLYFQKNAILYADNFLKNAGFVQGTQSVYYQAGHYEELKELLHYKWDEKDLLKLQAKNIVLEVFLGSNDQIVDTQAALEFFKRFGEVYYIKDKGHIL